MTKFEALKHLPVDRFADLFYAMSCKASNSTEFRDMLTEEFTEDLIPALLMCSTGEDLKVNDDAIHSDNNNSLREEAP